MMTSNGIVAPCLTRGLASSSHYPAEKAKPRIKCGATEEVQPKAIGL